MRKNAEKSEFINARAVKVWSQAAVRGIKEPGAPYFYVILEKIGHGMDFLDQAAGYFAKLSMSLGENRVF